MANSPSNGHRLGCVCDNCNPPPKPGPRPESPPPKL
jgi:hypothetical protein